MSAPSKPRGGQASELTKLKLLDAAKQEVIWAWRDEMDGDKPLTNAQIRNRLTKQYNIRLSRDGQLSEFWRWFSAQQELEQSNDLIEQFEEFTRTKNPDWSPDKVRQTGIEFFMAHTVAKKDADKFATIVTLDQRERFGKTKASLEERRLALDQSKFLIESDAFMELMLKRAAELLGDNTLTQADRIAAMRQAAFADVEALKQSGKLKIPQA